MKKIFLLFSIIWMFAGVEAQHVCGHHASAQDIDYIQNTIATLSLPKNSGTTCIPIKLYIVRQSNGSGGISLNDIHKGIAYLNEYYYPAGIEFYICGTGPTYINNSTYYDFQSTNESALAAAAGETNVSMNMYFVNSINYSGGSSYTAGYAYTPANAVQTTRVVLRNDDVADGLTIVHEVGHFFSLLHTFTDPNGNPTTELVNGSNCTTKGDLICDTPADPGYTGANVDFNCNYIGTATDANNQLYTPDIDNAMSYYPPLCMNPFVLTPNQITRIQQGLATRQSHSAYNLNCSSSNVTDPSNLTASIVGSTVVLNWTDNSTNETGFLIERSTQPTTGFRAYGTFGVGPNVTTFTDNIRFRQERFITTE